jgi:hypothetical protein
MGTVDTQCGSGGLACQNCQNFNETCQGQQCVGVTTNVTVHPEIVGARTKS